MTWVDARDVRLVVARHPLATALMLSLVIHLVFYSGWRIGKQLGWWQHQATWLLDWNKKKKTRLAATVPPPPTTVPQPREIPLTFVEVDPAAAAAEAPKDARHYGLVNTKAANPDATVEAAAPKARGQQDKMPRLEDVPKPKPFPLQPAVPPPTPEPPAQAEAKPKSGDQPGDLALAKPAPEKRTDPGTADAKVTPRERPRTLAAARLQKGLAGEQMKQDGGVRNRARLALDVKATKFAAYDAMFIEAVQQRWYDLLDQQQFVQRSGKVVLEFRLYYDGRISDLKVSDNEVGEILSWICQRAVTDPSPYQRWPDDMRKAIGANYREVTFTFYYN